MSRLKKSDSEPRDRYLDVMRRIRQRFDAIDALAGRKADFTTMETMGFQFRKIIEGISFGCVIATEHSTKEIPRSAAGQWNAEAVFKALKRLAQFAFPEPNILRPATRDEQRDNDVKFVLEGIVDDRLSVDELIKIYRRTHVWNHEENPYVTRPVGEKGLNTLRADIARVAALLHLHRIGIQGKSFICTIKDKNDGLVKILPIEKVG